MPTSSPAFGDDSLLALRFHNTRPGLELIQIADAALPVARITAEVLAQDSKDLPLMEEFVLRLVDHNVSSARGIAGLLGLPENMVDRTVAVLFGSDDLKWGRPTTEDAGRTPSLRLTDKGHLTAQKAAAVAPVRVNQPLVYDQMLWKVAPYDRRTTIPRGQAEENGMIMLPVARSGPVNDGDITAAEITALLRENGNNKREVLQVKGISQAPARRVLPVKLLVYADADRTDVEVGIVVDGELSQAHELALIGHGGAKALGITVAPPPNALSWTLTLKRPAYRCRRSPSSVQNRPHSSSALTPPRRVRRKFSSHRQTRSEPSASSSTRTSSTTHSPTLAADS